VVTRTRLTLRLNVYYVSCSFSKPPKNRVRGLSEEAKWLGTWSWQLTSIMGWKHEWSYIFTSRYAFTEWRLITGRENTCFIRTPNIINIAPQSLRTTLEFWPIKNPSLCVCLLWIETHQLHDAVNGSVVSVTQPLHAVVATTHKT